ncbi:MAG TPA: hypothetical protein VJN18_12925 [Polyangiaceae bacterium]|nr:hypothetical protein [Polyangiaceae bacterium]
MGCSPRTDIGVGPSGGSGEAGRPGGGSSGDHAGSGTADGGDPGVGGATGNAGTGGGSDSPGTGGSAGTETGGSAGTETGGSAGAETGGSAGTETGGSAGSGAGVGGNSGTRNCSGAVHDEDLSGSQPADLPCGALGDLEASSGVIFNLGLTGVQWFERTDDRLLASDGSGNWTLWDLSDKTILASGEQARDPARFYCYEGCPLPDLASDRFTIVSSTQVELRSLLDGSLIATSPAPDKCNDPEDACEIVNHGGLASDGSYYWSGTAAGIKAWDDSGTLLLNKSGNYAKKVRVSAAPDELRIALGPAGGDVIERISINTGASTTSSFAGTFHSWFLDGARFLTTLNTTVRVYAADTATQEAIAALPQVSRLTGQDDYFWSLGWNGEASTMAIFAVADPSTPAAVYPNVSRPYPVANRIGVIRGTEATVIELDPIGITDSTFDLPPAPRIESFTSDAEGNWAVGNHWGVVYDGADLERPLSCGYATDIAGSEHGTVAIGTFVGILLFELTPDSRTYLGSIPFPSWDVDLSSDGSVLAAASLHTVTDMGDAALKIFNLPDRSEIRSLSYPPSVENVSVSALGNRFSYTTGGAQTVVDLAGNVSFTRSGGADTKLALSPDGSRVAAPSGTPNVAATTTNIYENGTLIDALTGYPLLWLDQDHLLVDTVGEFNNPNKPGGARIYAIPGGFQPGPRLPGLGYLDPQMVSSTEIYAEYHNSVYSLTTGERLWSCDPDSEGEGTVAAGNIVFTKANKVMLTPY